jgi:hypothetical protein
MKNSNYQNAKHALKNIAIDAKNHFKGDKPAIRMIINDNTHHTARDYNLTEHKTDLLHNYACDLHP